MSNSTAQQFLDVFIMLRVGHIPTVARMCHRFGFIDLINESIPCNTDLDIDTHLNSHSFNDDAIGNALDCIPQKGTLQLSAEVSHKATSIFNLDTG